MGTEAQAPACSNEKTNKCRSSLVMKVAFLANYLFAFASRQPIYALHRGLLEAPLVKDFGQFV